MPASKLLLSVAGEDAMGPVRDRLAGYGLPPERLVLLGKTRGNLEYLERFGQIDIALDTFPFNGITTPARGCGWECRA